MKWRPSENYPCPVCDYIFTLLIAFIWGGVVHFCDGPWWLVLIAAHFPAFGFLTDSRK